MVMVVGLKDGEGPHLTSQPASRGHDIHYSPPTPPPCLALRPQAKQSWQKVRYHIISHCLHCAKGYHCCSLHSFHIHFVIIRRRKDPFTFALLLTTAITYTRNFLPLSSPSGRLVSRFLFGFSWFLFLEGYSPVVSSGSGFLVSGLFESACVHSSRGQGRYKQHHTIPYLSFGTCHFSPLVREKK